MSISWIFLIYLWKQQITTFLAEIVLSYSESQLANHLKQTIDLSIQTIGLIWGFYQDKAFFCYNHYIVDFCSLSFKEEMGMTPKQYQTKKKKKKKREKWAKEMVFTRKLGRKFFEEFQL